MSDIALQIPGKPRSKGSYRAIQAHGRAFLKNSDDHLAEWTNLIKLEWQRQMRDRLFEHGESPGPWDTAFEVLVYCDFARPKSHFGTGRNAGKQKPTAPPHVCCMRRPDCDKILRAILDALEGCCWKDDCQVVFCSLRKFWSDKDMTTIEISGLIPNQ